MSKQSPDWKGWLIVLTPFFVITVILLVAVLFGP